MTQALQGAQGGPLASRLLGKTRRAQAAIVTQACNATSATLTRQFKVASDGFTRKTIHTINPVGEKPLPVATTPPTYG